MAKTPTVLIVDDDRTIQHLLADALSKEGFTVVVEKDGEWALKTFEKKPVDVVLLDLLLPAVNGFEVARRLRMLPRGNTVPLVFISGIYKSSQHRQDALDKYSVVEFLDKPVNLSRLKRSLMAALGERYPESAAEKARRAEVDARPSEDFADEAAKREVTDVELAAKIARSAAQAVKGDFQSKSFPELLAELYRWKAQGALLVRREKVKKIVYFREGRPVSVKSNLLSECLGKIMVREKMISDAECEESLTRMKSSARQQGTVLIEMGCINPHNLGYGLSLQLQTKLYDLFSWRDGDYQFNTKAEIPSETNTLDLTTAQVIYEGVKRAYDEERVREALGSVEDQFVFPSRDPLYLFQDIGFDEEELALLSAVDGRKTVATLLALALLPPVETLRFLYAMRCSQMIDFAREPARGPVQARFAKPSGPSSSRPDVITDEIPIPALPPPLPSGSRPQSLPLSAQPPPVAALSPAPVSVRAGSLLPELSGVLPAGLSSEERSVRERLAAAAAAMKKKDHFELLGVAPNATKEQVKRAYFALAKEYHPDKHFGSYSAEVKNLAAEIFDRISTAHDTLTDDEEREKYVSDLASGVKKDVSDEVSRILAAEGKFQRGEDFLRKGLYREAHEAFAEAVALYGEEGEFHAYLGWSLFQTAPGATAAAQKAIEHIESSIRLNPKVDKSYLFLGYIHKALSRPDRAERQFEKALSCNPDCTEALRELRLLGKGKR